MLESKNNLSLTIGLMVYNEAPYIANTIDSILAQNINISFELLISDNASDDGTSEIAEEYSKKHSDLIVYHRQKKNVGIIQNFNTLIRLAKGGYFILAGAHDLWSPNYVNKLYETISSNENVSLVAPKTILIDKNDKELKDRPGFLDTSNYPVTSRFISTLINNQNGMYGIYNMHHLRKTRLQLEMFGSGALMLSELALLGDLLYEPEAIWYRREVRDKENRQQRVKRYIKVLYSKRKPIILPHWRIPLEYFILIVRSPVGLSQKLSLLLIWPLIVLINIHLLISDIPSFIQRLFRGQLMSKS